MKDKLSAIKELKALMMWQHTQYFLHHGDLLRGSPTLCSDGKSHWLDVKEIEDVVATEAFRVLSGCLCLRLEENIIAFRRSSCGEHNEGGVRNDSYVAEPLRGPSKQLALWPRLALCQGCTWEGWQWRTAMLSCLFPQENTFDICTPPIHMQTHAHALSPFLPLPLCEVMKMRPWYKLLPTSETQDD